jgi:hypothetical protein
LTKRPDVTHVRIEKPDFKLELRVASNSQPSEGIQ